MSISRSVTVWCDGCSDWVQVSTALIGTAEGRVKGDGWTITMSKTEGKQHFCKTCSQKIKEEKRS